MPLMKTSTASTADGVGSVLNFLAFRGLVRLSAVLETFFFSFVVKFFISGLSSRELTEIIANMRAEGSHNC